MDDLSELCQVLDVPHFLANQGGYDPDGMFGTLVHDAPDAADYEFNN